jgi:SRSO17 transposase
LKPQLALDMLGRAVAAELPRGTVVATQSRIGSSRTCITGPGSTDDTLRALALRALADPGAWASEDRAAGRRWWRQVSEPKTSRTAPRSVTVDSENSLNF